MLAVTAEPDTDEPIETESIPSRGEAGELDTNFAGLRSAIPVVATLTPLQPDIAMTPDEVIAWDMLTQHGFSRRMLERDGELQDYLALGVKPEAEARWRGEYMERLMERYPEDSDVFFLLVLEYHDEPMLARFVKLLDEKIGTLDAPGDVVLSDCKRVLEILDIAGFDETEKLKCQVLEVVRRGESLLPEYDPDGSWRQTVNEIRQRWGR